MTSIKTTDNGEILRWQIRNSSIRRQLLPSASGHEEPPNYGPILAFRLHVLLRYLALQNGHSCGAAMHKGLRSLLFPLFRPRNGLLISHRTRLGFHFFLGGKWPENGVLLDPGRAAH
jgi:hypothetical protein